MHAVQLDFESPAIESPAALSMARPRAVQVDDYRSGASLGGSLGCVTRYPDRATRPQRWSDHDLIVRLCEMPVELAAPLLRSSLPTLDTPALLSLIRSTEAPHHRLVAARRGLDWRVVKALIATGDDETLTALVDNSTVHFDGDDLADLSRCTAGCPALRKALQSRPALGVTMTASDEELSQQNLKLLRLLRAGQIEGFVTDAALRLGCGMSVVHAALSTRSAVPFALLVRALAFDRAALPCLLDAWPHKRPQGGKVQPLLLSVFDLSADAARQKLIASMSAKRAA